MTRDIPKKHVPWANVAKSTQKKLDLPCTGLWTRYGHPIYAPDSFLNRFPTYCTDGELYIGPGTWSRLREIVSRLPENRIDSDWDEITYWVFDAPHPSVILKDRKIKCQQFERQLDGCYEWAKAKDIRGLLPPESNYRLTYSELRVRSNIWPSNIQLLKQHQPPESGELFLEGVFAKGGEGIMWRNPNCPYMACRHNYLLKEKACDDAEGIVTGYYAGEGKYVGMIGAFEIKTIMEEGSPMVTFKLSGFTDDERIITTEEDRDWAIRNPGSRLPASTQALTPHLRIGSNITFRYRSLSKDGIPVEARYQRQGPIED